MRRHVSVLAYRRTAGLSAVALGCLALANCTTSTPTKLGSKVDPRYGVSASPRVVEPGQPVPKGGGTYRVGKPYVIAGKTYYPTENKRYRREGIASWYGDDFHGRLTANGEVYDMEGISAAHPTLPMPSYARVTNVRNGRSLIVRVNDRGPYHADREIDLSSKAADLLNLRRAGTGRVRVEYVGPASLEGSDDRKLMATLRDNAPAPAPSAVMVASARPFVPQAEAPRRPVRMAAARSVEAEDEREQANPTLADSRLPVAPIGRGMAAAPLPPAREVPSPREVTARELPPPRAAEPEPVPAEEPMITRARRPERLATVSPIIRPEVAPIERYEAQPIERRAAQPVERREAPVARYEAPPPVRSGASAVARYEAPPPIARQESAAPISRTQQGDAGTRRVEPRLVWQTGPAPVVTSPADYAPVQNAQGASNGRGLY